MGVEEGEEGDGLKGRGGGKEVGAFRSVGLAFALFGKKRVYLETSSDTMAQSPRTACVAKSQVADTDHKTVTNAGMAYH